MQPNNIYIPKKRKEIAYGFESSTDNSKANTKIKTKNYFRKVKIACINKDATHYYFQLKVIESVNNGINTPKLLRKLNRAFDYLMLKVNKQGIIAGVRNIERLQVNWIKQKEILKKEYKGEAVLKLFKDIDATLQTEQKLIRVLQSPKMYGLFFNGYWLYDNNDINTDIKTTIRKEDDATTITATSVNKEKVYTGSFFYKKNNLIEGNIETINTKYNILCLG